VGTPFASVKWFRGRDTRIRHRSECPDASCCREAPVELDAKWNDAVRPVPKINSSLLAALPRNGILGVDKREVLEFLEAHEPKQAESAEL
jgi:XRE family transcriptional regulator, fatty acid utilization regulator